MQLVKDKKHLSKYINKIWSSVKKNFDGTK